MPQEHRFIAQRVSDNAYDPALPHQFVVIDTATGPAPDQVVGTDKLSAGYVGPLLTETEAAVIADALSTAAVTGRL